MAADHGSPSRSNLNDHLNAENALICPKYEDTVSIKCEEIHIKDEIENNVQTDDFSELRNYSSSEDSVSSKEETEIGTSASKVKKHFCQKCPYSSDRRSSVKAHMLTHSDNEVHGCKICSFVTNSRLSLRTHMASHRGRTKRYGCPECPYETQIKFTLDQHYLTHKDNSEVKIYKCPFCPLETRYKRSIMSHLKIHVEPEMEDEFECEKCLYRTKWRSKLKSHVRISHSRKHLYSCDQCTYQAKGSRTLRDHTIKAHTDPSEVQLLKCPHCPYENAIKRNLLAHVKRRHSIEKQPELKCELCSYVTTERQYMQRHSFVHQEATIECYHCGFRTKQKRLLSVHIKQHHAVLRSSSKQLSFKSDQRESSAREQGGSKPASAEAYGAGGGYDIPLSNMQQVLKKEEGE